MAFDNGYTAVTGGTLSAAQWNTHVRDNFTAVWVYTSAGDISYATSSTTLSRLAVGSTDQYLGVSGGAPAWVAFPNVQYHETLYTGSQTITGSSSWADIPNSSQSITVAANATVIAQATCLVTLTTGSNNAVDLMVSIDGSRVGFSDYLSSSGTLVRSLNPFGSASVSAGSITVKLQGKDQFSNNWGMTRFAVCIFVVEDY